ncbi:xanthine dehydrogenase small subunit [Natronospirillum operosum]|uniref:Xanthine dehydrogenase small subunit n=1 Tax=Natronospirillum operosum TaxID=2759953 RepID=A0A4Z0W6U7_9GAMM|nr:xanthine dehydrogenase small subunit [Natronospirillum operosum]TGG92069.1 xanthine dehydrogenase small subunit [Natronospirillum operosum]
MISFYLNGQPYHLDNLDPNLSILNWLRTNMRLTGTKEGCASGDCGACTVAIGSPHPDGTLHYTTTNSCISLIGSLHGKHLITVDALQQQPPHPVQSAMIEEHGAQCGFCTPGFIMSLFALHQNQQGQPASEKDLLETLSGNLCRCTGYRPILDAGRKAMVETWTPGAADPKTQESAHPLQAPDMAGKLTALANQPASIEADSGAWYQVPTDLNALRDLRRQWPESRLIAGSTDLALDITQQLKTLPQLISVERIPELLAIEDSADSLTIGAAATYESFRPALSRLWPAFDPMLSRLGSRQIRYRGTLGGNIGNASPIADMPPPLIALGATLLLDGPEGERSLPLEEFFLDYKVTDLQPGEFIRSVSLLRPGPNEHLFIYKVSKRLDDDISAVLGAFWLRLEQGAVTRCRLAWGGMAATPVRSPAAEQALTGKPWNEATIKTAGAALAGDFKPMSDARASADYRRQVAANLLRRAWLSTQTPAQPVTVTDYA